MFHTRKPFYFIRDQRETFIDTGFFGFFSSKIKDHLIDFMYFKIEVKMSNNGFNVLRFIEVFYNNVINLDF